MRTLWVVFFHLLLFCSSVQAGASRDFEKDNAADYLDRGDDFYSDTLSLTAWVKMESTTNEQIWIKRNTPAVTSANSEWLTQDISPNFAFNGWKDNATLAYQVTTADAGTGVWVHVAGTSTGNGGTATLYKNGVVGSTATPSAILQDTASRIQLGARSANNNTRWFDGLIAQALSSNKALTAVEVVDSMWEPDVVTNGRQHYFPIFGDSPEVDLSGNGRNATVNGTVVSADGPPVFMGEGLPL